MSEKQYQCPLCQTQFRLPAGYERAEVRCPKCKQVIRVSESIAGDSSPQLLPAPPPPPPPRAAKAAINGGERTESAGERVVATGRSAGTGEEAVDLPPVHSAAPPAADIDDLLPPRFASDQGSFKSQGESAISGDGPVLLPNAEGGFEQYRREEVVVEYRGEKVPLAVPTPGEQLRRRIIYNAVSILIGLAILLLLFWWLTRGL